MGARVVYDGVQKRYGPVQALRSTSLTIESGEFLSIIGPSGSGKTTLLGITVGYIPPTAGHIRIDGVDIVGVPPFKRNIGMVFQNYSLFPHMTIAENIAFPLRMRGIERGETAERVKRMLSMVRLPGFGDRKPSELSGGQQQRVALARAAVYDPLLLLMDEPLSALDKNLREEMQYELKQFQRQLGATVLYVTHDQNEAAAMSDRIGIMNEGSLVQLGTARELYEHPSNRFVASFLGEANIFRLETEARVSRSTEIVRSAGGMALKVAAGQAGSYACVRPEAISIGSAAGPDENAVTGVIADATFTAGSILYRVTADSGEPVIVRMPSARKQSLEQPGTQVRLAWKVSDTLLIADS
jgi:putative spermidine/putrescine transport system ATP-binding protein